MTGPHRRREPLAHPGLIAQSHCGPEDRSLSMSSLFGSSSIAPIAFDSLVGDADKCPLTNRGQNCPVSITDREHAKTATQFRFGREILGETLGRKFLRRGSRNEKTLRLAGLSAKRLKGFEPSTFCMAILQPFAKSPVSRLVRGRWMQLDQGIWSCFGTKFGTKFRPCKTVSCAYESAWSSLRWRQRLPPRGEQAGDVVSALARR